MRVAISIGHNPQDPGATHRIFSEYTEMAPIAGILIHLLETDGHEAHLIQTGDLIEEVEKINALHCDCAVELHANAGGGEGCETLYCPGSRVGKPLAESVQLWLSSTLNCADRGVKEGWYKMDPQNGPDYFLSKTNCPAIITEPYFIDTEWEKYAGNALLWGKIAQAVRSGITNWRS